MAEPRFASASLLEDARFNQTVVLPNALQGIFKRRPKPVAVATRMDVDGQAVGVMRGMRKGHGPRPLWVHLVKDSALLLLDVEDVARALDGSPQPFASDPPAKRTGMGHFQPDALTLSRGELWADRRRFTESVLESPKVKHSLGNRFVAIVVEELAELEDTITYDALHAAYRRITRRIVLGDAARDDEEISELLGELMSQANGLPSDRSDEYAPFMEALSSYAESAPDGSLAGIAMDAESTPDTRVDGQLPHWLFAMQDTLSANAMRALALIAAQPEVADVDEELAIKPGTATAITRMPRLRAALQEAMRLWPTTPLLSRELLADVVWHGVRVPAGTQVLIPNSFHHRDPERLGDAADRFTPEGWLTGDFSRDRGFNHFSQGPQGCPGSNLSLLIGTATLSFVLRAGPLSYDSDKLAAGRDLPHMLDVFSLKLRR